MNTLLLLYKLQWTMLVNKHFKDKKQTAKSLLLIGVILGVAVAAISFLKIKVIGSYDDILADDAFMAMMVVLSMVFMLISAFQFFASLMGLIPNFYQSPDMNYLVSTPLKSGVILVYKLFNHTVSTIMKEAIFFLPILLAISISLKVSPVFYLFLPFVYFLIATTSAGVGVFLGMLYLRRFSMKSYRYLINGGHFILVSSVWAFAVFNVSVPNPLVRFAEWIFTTEYLYLALPFISGAEVLAGIGVGSLKGIAIPALFLLSVPALITFITYKIAQKSFYTGWMNSVPVEKAKKVEKHTPAKVPEKCLTPILSMIKYEWIRASKNYDIMMGSLMFFAMYGLLIFFSNRLGSDYPILFICIAMAVGISLVYIASSVPFVSSDIMKNPLTAKYQHSLLKYLPVSSREILLSRNLMITLPSIIILTIGISVLSVMFKLTFYTWLMIVITQIIITVGYGVLTQSFDIVYYQRFFHTNKFVGGLLSIVIQIVYFFLTIGLYIVYILDLSFLKGLTNLLNVPLIVIVAAITVIFQLTYSFKKGQEAWDKMEF